MLKHLFFVLFIGASFLLANDFFTFTLSQKQLDLGDVVQVDLYAKSSLDKATVLLNRKKFDVFLFNQKRHHYRAYVGISRYAKSGQYKLKIFAKDLSGQLFEDVAVIEVKHVYEKGIVRLSKKKKTLAKKKVMLKKELFSINKGFSMSTPQFYLKKGFLKPVKDGKKTSAFGAKRSYKGLGKGVQSHAGVDYGGSIGTPVLAANRGTVVVSEFFDYHGHTIMIDHGFGIVTIYTHLNARDVEVGALVKRGRKIGEVGDTGVATGPHLHWGMSVQNVRVNPEFWLTHFKSFK